MKILIFLGTCGHLEDPHVRPWKLRTKDVEEFHKIPRIHTQSRENLDLL